MMAFPRPERAKRDPAYLAEVRRLPCACCGTTVGVSAHHPIEGRYSQRKADDRKAYPLCEDRCHALRHRRPEEFLLRYGPEDQLSARTQATIDNLRAEMIGGRRNQ